MGVHNSKRHEKVVTDIQDLKGHKIVIKGKIFIRHTLTVQLKSFFDILTSIEHLFHPKFSYYNKDLYATLI